MNATRVTKLELALLAAILLWGTLLRGWHLGQSLFWVDEAESTLNAMVILQHGYPVNQYLHLPIYENTLTELSPANDEYEFRDTSYSKKGVAAYHGWFPLYSIAASLKAFGFKPDADPGDLHDYTPTVRHDERYAHRLTKAARVPAVIFGTLFLLAIFFVGREIGGRDVGWAALLAAALSERAIAMAREARYYSATILVGLLACWIIWRILRRGAWRDFVLGGLTLGLLFHTHSISFLVAFAALGIGAAVRLLRALRSEGAAERRRFIVGMCATVAIAGAMTIPWALAIGFFGNANAIPKAWQHIKWPEDFLVFPLGRPATLVLLAIGFATLLAADLFRRRSPARVAAPFAERRGAVYLLVLWVVLGYLAFVFGMPAASFAAGRMSLPMLGPGIVLVAMICSAVAKVILANRFKLLQVLAAPLMLVGFLTAMRGAVYTPAALRMPDRGNAMRVIEMLAKFPFRPGTRIYATPNRHLVFTVYSGMPVQAISPIRKRFLDAYDRDVMVIENEPLYEPPRPERVQEAARAAGLPPMPLERAWDWSWATMYKALVDRTAADVADVHPRPTDLALPDFLRPLAANEEASTARWIATEVSPVEKFPAMFRGFEVRNNLDWWPIYFYRFVDPLSRMGRNLNYHDRMSRGTAWVLPMGWRIDFSPGTASGPTAGEFENSLSRWWTPYGPAQDDRLSQIVGPAVPRQVR